MPEHKLDGSKSPQDKPQGIIPCQELKSSKT